MSKSSIKKISYNFKNKKISKLNIDKHKKCIKMIDYFSF